MSMTNNQEKGKQEEQYSVANFIREFMNDHNGWPPRWLRGAFIDEKEKIEKILEYMEGIEKQNSLLDSHTAKAEKEQWEQPCKGCGHHDTYYKTVVTSPQWKSWVKTNPPYDIPECEELGIISAKHFEAFMKFCTAKVLEDVERGVEEISDQKENLRLCHTDTDDSIADGLEFALEIIRKYKTR